MADKYQETSLLTIVEGEPKTRGLLSRCGDRFFTCATVFACIAIFGLNIAKIIIGGVYYYECPFEPRMSIWLLVSGASSLLYIVLVTLIYERKITKGYQVMSIFTIGSIFLVTWVILGSIWVYPKFAKIHADDITPCADDVISGCDQHCNDNLLSYAVFTVTLEWIETLLLILNGVNIFCLTFTNY